MKRLVIVLGVETNGTKFLTEIFVNGGYFGDVGHSQRVDNIIKKQRIDDAYKGFDLDKIVLRRSLPHDGHMIDVKKTIEIFNKLGYIDVKIIVIIRNWNWVVKSQSNKNHRPPKDTGFGWQHQPRDDVMRYSYHHLFKELTNNYDFYIVTYESLIYETDKLKDWFEYEFYIKDVDIKVINGNKKYFK